MMIKENKKEFTNFHLYWTLIGLAISIFLIYGLGLLDEI